MRTHLIPTVVLFTAALSVLPSCDEKTVSEQQSDTKQTAVAEQPAQQAAPAPTAADVMPVLMPYLAPFSFINAGEVSIEAIQDPDSGYTVTAKIPAKVRENLYTRQNAPESFNEERKAINENAAAAMRPESHYLMQVGAPSDSITEEDRQAKPLPENLQQLANELKDLSESSVFVVSTPADAELTVTASLKAVENDGKWEMRDVVVDTSALHNLEGLTAESALPEGEAVMTPDFEESRRQEIRTKIAAFNEAAAPYIQSREDVARSRMVEFQARQQEETRKAAEQAQAESERREQWQAQCTAAFAVGKGFSGEWSRGQRFGSITVRVDTVAVFDNAVQFFGQLYDTKLPEACLDIEGRCGFTQDENGCSEVNITIYDGQYDPDQPTAEVYDARDGMLSLKFSPEGKMEGIMSCASWSDNPDKAFKVQLSPTDITKK